MDAGTKITMHFVDLPESIRGAVMQTDQGYLIAIQAGLPEHETAKIIAHELQHIAAGDFDKEDVQRIEKQAHREPQESV